MRTTNVIKPNSFCYYVQKDLGFRENFVSVIVSTFHIFKFVDHVVTHGCVFSAVLINVCPKTTRSDLPL